MTGKGEIIGETLFGFFDAMQLDRAVAAQDFTIDEAVEVLVDVARHSTNPWARLAALKILWERGKDSLVLSGVIRPPQKALSGNRGGERQEGESRALRLLGASAETTKRVLALPAKEQQIEVVVGSPDEEIEDGEIDGETEERGLHVPPTGGSDVGGLHMSRAGMGIHDGLEGDGTYREDEAGGDDAVFPDAPSEEWDGTLEPDESGAPDGPPPIIDVEIAGP